jgi:hypothetical protein
MKLTKLRGALSGCLFLTFLPSVVTVSGQTNSWIKPSSGNWDDPSAWSLGVLPTNSQSVLIANSGWKAVAINPATPINFPGSMTVDSLAIRGAWDTMNTLLLNYSGTATPLRVLNDFNIEAEGRVQVLYSGVNVGDALNLNGVFDQEGGELTFTNSLASVMQIEGGRFNLTNGLVNGANMYLGGTNDGYVNQYSGLVSLNWLVLGSKAGVLLGMSNGTYVLQNGWLMVGTHELVGQHGFGTLTQNGGTNSCSDISVGNGTYVKNGGGLFGGEVRVLGTSEPTLVPPAGIMTHAGGTATITNVLRLVGQSGRLARFNMLGGSLATPRIQLEMAGLFSQSNGTVHVASELFIDDDQNLPSTYYLSGGNVFANRTTISSPSTAFAQSGGAHVVTNTLWISGDTIYRLSGGTVSASNIVLSGNLPNPPQFFVLGAPPFTVANQTISMFGGAIVIQDSAQQFGRLTLPADSGINLAGSSAILRFADSHTNSWESELFGVVPRLVVYNWNGSTNGGGADQLSFGNNSSALTAIQLAQIQFVNPAGFPPGTNSARILSTGEVVPDQGSSNSGLVNSWIKPLSGNWDDPSAWSLGVLPTNSQSVLITNPVWKAVAITASTPINFPESMTVGSLTIRGAWDTMNTLLLNHAGTTVPLTVLDGLVLQDMARIVNFNSALVVQGGTIVVTNGEIIHDFGLVRTTGAPMYLQNSHYHLTNGLFEGGTVLLGWPVTAHFNQYGGTAIITNLVFAQGALGAGGRYALYGGDLRLPGGLRIMGGNNSFSSYLQAGGTNQTTSVFLEPNLYGVSPSFTLNGGLLADNDVSMVADNFGGITIEHNGGTHIVTNTLNIAGGNTHGTTIREAVYRLNGGTLSAGVIELNANQGDSLFVQSSGTTRAETIYAHSVGFYGSFVIRMGLAGGSLSCSNFTLDDGRGSFNQTGGALVVSNLLTIGGYRDLNTRYYGSYRFTGGTVTASNINIAGDWVIGDGSVNRISNSGFLSLSHTLQIGNAVEQLGRFILTTNATIDLAGGASRLSFANSSGESWAGAATLAVPNWNGNLSGGGAEQLKFGTSQSGLTPAQLNRIRFVNPAGMPAGSYSARILNTGEVVPSPRPAIGMAHISNRMVISWTGNYQLYSSTNLAGPFSIINGATSPYTNTFNEPRRFFYLRSP